MFFVKKVDLSSTRVHYVQYQYFLFYILLIWEGGVRTPLPTGLDMSRDCIPGLLEYAVA